MTTAANRELLALRTHLATHLRPDDAAALAWPVVAAAAGPGIGRGWTGAELGASSLLGAYSGGIDSIPAYVVANLRDLAAQDPPREQTATPPPVADVRADLRSDQPSSQTSQWHTLIQSAIQSAT